MATSTSFADQWGFPRDVMSTIPGATTYKFETRLDKFRSGREKLDVVFSNCNGEIARRTGMRLISKKSQKPYEVCSKFPENTLPARLAQAGQ